jgi:hypothetical protein
MPQQKTAKTTTSKTTTSKTTTQKTSATANGRKPSDQALQAVDVAVGAWPTAAEAVTETADTWRNSETRNREIETLKKRVSNLRESDSRTAEIDALRERLGQEIQKAETKGGDVRRQVTDQLVGRARKARERVEPVYRERVEPVYKKRVEPLVKEHVEPVYRQRFEPTVKRVAERI